MKTGPWPIGYLHHQPVFDRIVMDIIDVVVHILYITDGVLPKSALPNSGFMLIYVRDAPSAYLINIAEIHARENTLNFTNAHGIIRVAFRQGYHRVEVIWQ